METRRTDDGLDGLGAEWDDLFARCAAATPFQSYAWLESWWRTYGEPGRLRLTLVRHGDRLVAAAPMMLRWRSGCPVLTPLGGPFSDFTDVLLDDAMAAQAAAVLAADLIRQPGWQAIDFPETRPGSVAATALWRRLARRPLVDARLALPGTARRRRWRTWSGTCRSTPARRSGAG